MPDNKNNRLTREIAEARKSPAIAQTLNATQYLGPDELLTVISVLIGVVHGTLDTGSADCRSCGCTVYDDFAESNAAKQLDGAHGRIQRVKSVLAKLAEEEGR